MSHRWGSYYKRRMREIYESSNRECHITVGVYCNGKSSKNVRNRVVRITGKRIAVNHKVLPFQALEEQFELYLHNRFKLSRDTM